MFSKQTAREKYLGKLKKISSKTAIAWERTARIALQQPLEVPAPYAETGYFSGKLHDAVAFRFLAKAGQLVTIKLLQTGNSSLTTFTDLWNANDTSSLELLESADTLLNEMTHSSIKDQNYIVRMQPAAGDSGRFELTITLSPMLGYPIPEGTKSNVGSFWGADRDGGSRNHEGVDIFAKKGSNVLAVADGYITRTGETNLGGKVVWLRPSKQNISVYYAHLDSQLVTQGQFVKAGEPLGLMGNTGNAKFTPAHLHFGIYTRDGAIDPIDFIREVKNPGEGAWSAKLNRSVQLGKGTKFYASPEKRNTMALDSSVTIITQAVSGDFFRVSTKTGQRMFVPKSEVK